MLEVLALHTVIQALPLEPLVHNTIRAIQVIQAAKLTKDNEYKVMLQAGHMILMYIPGGSCDTLALGVAHHHRL